MIESIIGSVAGVLTVACYIPQLIKTFKTKSANDFSYYYIFMLIAGSALWTSYGVFRSDMIIFLVNLTIFCFVIAFSVMKIKYSKQISRA